MADGVAHHSCDVMQDQALTDLEPVCAHLCSPALGQVAPARSLGSLAAHVALLVNHGATLPVRKVAWFEMATAPAYAELWWRSGCPVPTQAGSPA